MIVYLESGSLCSVEPPEGHFAPQQTAAAAHQHQDDKDIFKAPLYISKFIMKLVM